MKEQIKKQNKISHYDAKTYGWSLQEQLLLVPNYFKVIGNLNGKDVLDIGCGNGWLTYLMAKKAKSILGCDISESMIEVAEKNHKLPNTNYYALDATNINKLNKKFDVITCSLMLHASQTHNSMIKTLKSAANLLKKNGNIVILVPHPCFSIQNKRSYNTYTFSDSFNYFEKNQSYNVNLVSSKGLVTKFTNKFYNLQDYFDAFLKSGLMVTQISEPEVLPKDRTKNGVWTSELKTPFYLIFKVVKGSNLQNE